MENKLIVMEAKSKNFSPYSKFISRKDKNYINRLAKSLRTYKLTQVSDSSVRGGIAETLKHLIPLLKNIGIETTWYTFKHDQEFYRVVTKIRKFIHGKSDFLTKSEKDFYLKYNYQIAKELKKISTDVLIIHDQQPLASVNFINNLSKKIWYCHEDTSFANNDAWKFLSNFLGKYDRFVFSSKKFAPKTIPLSKVSIFQPAIDPYSKRNTFMSRRTTKEIIKSFGIDPVFPLITQVSRLTPVKDPECVIEAYKMAKSKIRNLQLAFVAQTPKNHQESKEFYDYLLSLVKGDTDVHFIVNAKNNDKVVNAFQRESDIIIQKSVREGFGQSVTEGMWKGKPVIGGDTIGIREQIRSEVNGIIVSNTKECAEWIVALLNNSKFCKILGASARKTVENRFLIPRLVLDYLLLIKRVLDD